MRVLVQRSDESNVMINNKKVGSIDKGLVLLVGFTEGDNIDTIKNMVNKVINLRIFDDQDGIMNKNILDTEGSILSISQFTLYADTKKGNRPSYVNALSGDKAEPLYNIFNEELNKHVHIETGEFGADMVVNITNNGPVTILLER